MGSRLSRDLKHTHTLRAIFGLAVNPLSFFLEHTSILNATVSFIGLDLSSIVAIHQHFTIEFCPLHARLSGYYYENPASRGNRSPGLAGVYAIESFSYTLEGILHKHWSTSLRKMGPSLTPRVYSIVGNRLSMQYRDEKSSVTVSARMRNLNSTNQLSWISWSPRYLFWTRNWVVCMYKHLDA